MYDIYLLCVVAGGWGGEDKTMQSMKAKGQLVGVGSRGSGLQCQAWWQEPFPAEPSHWLKQTLNLYHSEE